ncbi:drug/metabolite transporter (DMT)-like permease [Methylopila capsulata]|uniref:DMT transporter permease n=1 Tax=Methylopila capsulata TaxID=61654 RepID=A0A9W6IYX0_9HYPH|nr:DMT family transporter [Methylopila capsulata]MBM7853120.1 drug/metabolite transporter (DMT)-like permease [Methylopila capsulata]GLK57666.1 DMT transporter permease [Methylopila capsulata]
MTLASALLVILAAVIHASWNIIAKRAAAVGPAFVFSYNLIACVAYAPWVAYLGVHGGLGWSWRVAPFLFLSGLIHLGYSLCLQLGYQRADLSVVYPVARGTGPMLSSLGAIVILGEAMSWQSLLGLALVIAGIGLVATQGDLSAFRRPGGQAGVVWGSATGGLIAAYTVVDAYAVKTLHASPVFLDWCSNVLRFILLAPLVAASPARALRAMRESWPAAIAVGLLSPLAYILVLVALDDGAPLSVVAPMREMSMMVGALMGMAILREPVGPWRLVGCAVLTAGVVLLSSS